MRAEPRLGFTLLEVVVALAVFSLAALALLNVAGQNARTAAALERRVFAALVAENVAVEATLSPILEPDAVVRGSETAGGRVWRWERRLSATADPDLVRLDIAVREENDPQEAASLVVFRAR